MIRRTFAALVLLWAFGFAIFVTTLPRPADGETTDGIIVLTGGPGRLQRGLAMLQAGKARRMLVSGVAREVGRRQIASVFHIPSRLMTRIDLGYESVDTRSNADEAARWIEGHGYRSIRLVTTDWHMPRARLELARDKHDGVSILSDPVPSEPGLIVLLREYHKFLLRSAAAVGGY